MKILYIHQYFATRKSATGTRSYEFSKILHEKGHEITILTGDSKIKQLTKNSKKRVTELIYEGLKIKAIKNNYDNKFNSVRRIYSFLSFLIQASFFPIKNKDYDVIFATSTPLTIAIPALILSKRAKVPFVFEVRDLWPEAPYQLGYIKSKTILFIMRKLEKHTYEQSAHVVALSQGMADGVLKHIKDPRKVTIIPNSSDLDLFATEDAAMKEMIRKKYDIAEKFVLIHGGSMGVINGLDYLVEVAKELKEQEINDVAILLTGDGQKKGALEAKAQSYQLKNIYFTGMIPRKEMPNYLAVSHLTMTSVKNNPVLEMASPNKFFDSLAASKPIIINCEGWMKTLIEKERCGFYVDPTDPKSMVELIKKLRNNLPEVNKLGENARKLAEKQFDRRELADKLEKTLEEAISHL